MSALNRDRWEQYKAEVVSKLDFSAVYRDIRGAKPSGNGHLVGLCPFHDDHTPSFGYSIKDGTWECFAGCGKGDVFAYLTRRSDKPFMDVLLELGDRVGVPRPENGAEKEPLVTYSYRDETGAVLFQVLRSPGKGFWQRRPNGPSGWINNLKGVRPVPYRLPDLLARPDETVLIVEGEKDADRLHEAGLLATTNSGGAGKWKAAHSECLRGRDVAILPDNDAPGRDHATKVERSLQGVAASVRVVDLPDLPEKGDVSDWFDAGHTVEELQELVEQAASADPPRTEPPPRIQTNQRQLTDVIPEAWDALLAQNDPPRLFSATGGLARIVFDDGTPRIELLDESSAFGLLVRAAYWYTVVRGGEQDAKPPKDLARDILSFPHDDLPRLDSVATTPVFDAAGRLIATSGYHPCAKIWMHLGGDIKNLQVPDKPSRAQIEKAVDLIREHLLYDFPFAAESDEAHAIAAVLLLFVRRMILGPTPIHLIEAPVPGSGKSLLADLIAILVTGRASEATTITRNEDESRKKLTAILSRGRSIVTIDNVQGGLESSQLASAITTDTWSDRILGKTQMVEFPNRAVWLVTGNNPKLTMEIARRCVRIRLEPQQERPWEREGFRHDPIRTWALERRPALVRAALVIIQGWVAAGRPMGTKTLGSFESWASVIGGILQFAGVRDFLADTQEFYETADSDGADWRAFATAWWDVHGDRPVSIGTLLQLAVDRDLIPFAIASKSEHGQKVRLGKALNEIRDRRIGDVRVICTTDTHSKTKMYRLAQAAPQLLLKESR
ncbi:hypothetical protein KKA85_10615 [bacterium]|nr:hypothetical protein [bacterium]